MISGFCHGVDEIFLLWYVTQCRLVVTDIMGQPSSTIFKSQSVQVVDFLTLQDIMFHIVMAK